MMNKPLWITIVGIILIVMGCLGLMGAWQTFGMPRIVAQQKQMLPYMQQKMEQQKDYTPEAKQRMQQMYERMMTTPAWFDNWCLFTAPIALLFSALFIYSGINLLLLRKTAANLIYWVLGADLGFLVIRGLVGLVFLGWIGISMVTMGVLAGIADIILLAVVANGNKQAFENK